MKVCIDLAGPTGRNHDRCEPVSDLIDHVFDFHVHQHTRDREMPKPGRITIGGAGRITTSMWGEPPVPSSPQPRPLPPISATGIRGDQIHDLFDCQVDIVVDDAVIEHRGGQLHVARSPFQPSLDGITVGVSSSSQPVGQISE